MIQINNLYKSYGIAETKVDVLKGIDLNIAAGKLVCLLGPSGSGKSTLLNILGGIEHIDKGSVTVFNHELEKMNNKELTLYRRNNVGFVFQFYNLISDLAVEENIQVGQYVSKSPLDLDRLISSLGLSEQRKKYPNEISGGQAQRTSIARAIIKKPSLLICDEPTGALDYESGKEVLELIENLNHEYKTTVIIATHNSQIAKMCDICLHLRNGQIGNRENNETKISAREVEW